MSFSNLPNELLINIFFQLHQNDLAESMLVSRHWKKLIEDYALYRTVLVHSEAAMEKLTEKLQQRPDIAVKIEKVSLSLGNSGENMTAKNNFLSLLDNLKTLHFDVLYYTSQIPINFSWQNQINYISGNFFPSHHSQRIVPNAYPNLTTLRITIELFERNIFSAISAVPNLVELSVDSVIIGLNTFDSIHGKLPRLESLKIRSLTCDSGLESIETITPAHLLTEFMVGYEYDPQRINSPTHANLLEYIRKKYPNLTILKYKHCTPRLSNIVVQNINDSGRAPFFQEPGSHLKKLYINLYSYDRYFEEDARSFYIYDDFFEKLDTSSCKISDLSLEGIRYGLLKKIQNSQQTRYIQTLELIGAKCGSFEWLKSLSVLRKLILNDCYHSRENNNIRMSDIINNSPPTLVTLSLLWNYLDFDTSYIEKPETKPETKPNITKLTLCLFNIKNLPDTFFSRFFPRLLKLKVKDSPLPTRTLNLETMDLLDFEYGRMFMNKPQCTILVEQRKHNERRYYQSKYNTIIKNQKTPKEAFDYQAYVPFKSYPADDFNHVTPDIILICNSVDNVVFLKSFKINQ